jgi:ATP-dependent DNA helicase RecQ
MTKHEVLKRYFGYDTFRPLQAEIIDTIVAGNDCLVLMPTGGGKSVCFQVPAMLLEGITIVISPLIALMQDQVRNLKAMGIEAEFVNSSLSPKEQYDIESRCRQGEIKLLYISPEKLFSANYIDFLQSLNISLFAIDESHCVSFWGHDFRPEYTQLRILKNAFGNIPVVALTATADRVTRKDIITQLNIPNAEVFISSFDRPNLSLKVVPGRNRVKIIQDFIKQHPKQAGIIYCLSRKATETVAEALNDAGISAKHYHAGMSNEYRRTVQEAFIKDDIQVIVATIAFGMGIDKPNVRWVIHYNLPNNVESYYQEIGRAGRDGLPSDTLLFYSFADVMTRQDMLDKSELSPEMKEIQQAKLDRMKQYAEAEICRRRILLSYFNETVLTDCGNCDVCQNPPKRFDGTLLAQKALSGIARTNQQVAMGMLIDILRGSQNRQVLSKGYHQLKTFGVGKDVKNEEWADYLFQMVQSGVMDTAIEDGHKLRLTELSWKILKENYPVKLVKYEHFSTKKARQEAEYIPEKSKKQLLEEALTDRLKALRKRLADAQNMPAYVVFSDATIADMVKTKPINRNQMMNVQGLGEQKMRLYGDVFIKEIIDFARENSEKGTTRVVKGMTYLETLELYKHGFTIEEMANKRLMSIGTITSHLFKLSNEGESIDFKRFIPDHERIEICQRAKLLGIEAGQAMKPLFEFFAEQYSYDKLRIALAAGG